MSDGFIKLIANRNLRSFHDWFAGPEQEEFSALIAEQRHDHGMFREKVLLKLHLRIVVKTEHRKVECEHILLGDMLFSRGGSVADDYTHIVGEARIGSADA